MECRFCNKPLTHLFLSLGSFPLSNSFLTREQLYQKEVFYPLDVYVCDSCFLVQLQEYETPGNIFGDYAYFSSYSETWLNHAKEYVDDMIRLFGIDRNS